MRRGHRAVIIEAVVVCVCREIPLWLREKEPKRDMKRRALCQTNNRHSPGISLSTSRRVVASVLELLLQKVRLSGLRTAHPTRADWLLSPPPPTPSHISPAPLSNLESRIIDEKRLGRFFIRAARHDSRHGSIQLRASARAPGCYTSPPSPQCRARRPLAASSAMVHRHWQPTAVRTSRASAIATRPSQG